MKCIACETALTARQKRFCSNQCQADNRYNMYIATWLAGNSSGMMTWPRPSCHIRKWLFVQREEQCWECGWNRKHPATGKCPLEVDHIDGDFSNNRPENLRLLCGGCHSLTLSYKNRNRGHGRPVRRRRYQEGKTY